MTNYGEILDGTHCFRKTWLAGRLGALTATLGAVFAATSCISAELRDAPEDPMNYFIGGCASGAMIGAKTNSFVIGSSACVGLGALAAFVKVGRQQGWTFLVLPRQ
ncbi:hypothetical protein Chor_017121 [Crotalus horridus]